MKINRTITMLMVAIILVTFIPTSAFAAMVDSSLTKDQQAWMQSNVSVDNGKISSPDMSVRGKLSIEKPKGDYCSLTLKTGDTVYWSKTSDMSMAASINRTVNNDAAGGKMSDLTQELDINADTQSAGVMLSGLAPIVNLFLGIIATLIMFGMAISSSLDICYIAFPVFRNKLEDAKAEGKAGISKKSANGEVSLRWVTDDAQYAISSTVSEGGGKSPWGVYFKKRVGSYIFLTIIMFILLTGNITLITDIALKVVSGILRIMQSLA